MSMEFRWKGHTLFVQCQPSPKYLWLATETILKVDGAEIGRSGGFARTEQIKGKIQTKTHSSELAFETKMDWKTLASIPYKLHINKKIVSEGRLKVDHWFLASAPVLILLTLLFVYVVLR